MVLVALICLAGCDKLFGLPAVDSTDARGADASVDAVSTNCPGTYDITLAAFPGSRYLFQPVTAPWSTAQQLCIQDAQGGPANTHLVVLQDETERMALYAALLGKTVTVTVWIGLADRKVENQFRWVTDEPVGTPPPMTTPWPPNQPDNEGEQDCVRMKAVTETTYGGFFDDGGCSISFASVCECDDFAANPANYTP